MIKPLYFFFFVIVCLLGLMACSAKPQDKFKNLPFRRSRRRSARQELSRSRILQKRTQKPERRPHPYQLRLQGLQFR